ncbi:Transposase [Pseudoalteromonas mariniglutinosa]
MRKTGKHFINFLKLLLWLLVVEYKISNSEVRSTFTLIALVVWSVLSLIKLYRRSIKTEKKLNRGNKRKMTFAAILRLVKLVIEFILLK